MSTRSALLIALAIGMLAIPSAIGAGMNPNFHVPLHAMEGVAANCQDYLPVDCMTHRPVFNISPDQTTTVFVLMWHLHALAGLQTAFEWDPGWNLVSGHFECRDHQLSLTVPANPGGPSAGALITAFDCVTGISVQVIAYMVFDVGPQGCLHQVNPAPFTVSALDCNLELDYFDASQPANYGRMGKICVGTGGHDGCEPPFTAVEPATWGKVKATYRR